MVLLQVSNAVPATRIVVVDDLSTIIETFTKSNVVGFALDAASIPVTYERRESVWVVLDWNLGGANPQQVVRHIQKEVPNPNAPIFPAHMEPAAIRAALEAGAQGIVEKSDPSNKLNPAIRRLAPGLPGIQLHRRAQTVRPMRAHRKDLRPSCPIRCVALGPPPELRACVTSAPTAPVRFSGPRFQVPLQPPNRTHPAKGAK